VCSSVEVYTLGSETQLELAVAVENRGEDAFEATVRIFLPSEVQYVSVTDVAAPVCRRRVILVSSLFHSALYLSLLV